MNRKQRRTTKSQGSAPGGFPQDSYNALFQEALQHQLAGRLAEAEQGYRNILALEPKHAHSYHMLGLIAQGLQRHDIAEELIGKSIALQDVVPLFHNSMGNSLKALSRLDEAAASYKRALHLKPDYVEALNNLGTAFTALGDPKEATKLYKNALAIDPNCIEALNNLGMILEAQGRNEDAIGYYRRAIRINPNLSELHFNLANTLKAEHKFEEALQAYNDALAINANDADTLNNIGIIFEILNKLEEAETYYTRAIASRQDFAEAHYNLGNILNKQGKFDSALECYQKTISIRPHAQAHNNAAVILYYKDQHAEAMEHYQAALAIKPDFSDALNGMGNACIALKKFEQAIDCYEMSLKLNPDIPEVLSNLAGAFKDCGKLDEAIIYFKRALAIAPENNVTYSNLLLTMIYAASVSPEELAATARVFDERIAAPLRRDRPFIRNADPERKLRIGYLSPDLRNHAVHYFLEPLLKFHDHNQFEVFAYSNTIKKDEVTARLEKTFDHWRDICFLDNDKAADLIEADAIDVLIDVAGHTGHNRLLVFARKPAPVQVTWLGYPATTGMTAMDYRITDIHSEPAGMTEYLNVETLWRLPELFCCYQPVENSPDVIDHPPFEDNGHITFGCFNNFTKVTDPVLQAWARILSALPNSRLLLEIAGIDGPKFRTEVEEKLARFGLPLDRVTLELRKRSNQYALYNKIDIALDPFPCTGGTTTMDTLWMGVPLVTLAGHHFLSRMGVTFLTNIGMPELIAQNWDEYIDIAIKLAQDKDRLKTLRHGLRDRMKNSPLMDQEGFTRNMEAAYRGMWRKWCERQNG